MDADELFYILHRRFAVILNSRSRSDVTDRRTAIFQILLDTDESPALTLHTCTGPVHMPTDEELATSTVYRYM